MRADGALEPTLVLFCRRPAPGLGKQRIAAQAGTAFAAQLGEYLLATALEDATAWPGPVVLAPAAAADRDWAGGLLARTARVAPQPPGNLGERLQALDRQLRAAGHRQLIYIGSDAPMLEAAWYAQARAALAGADVVLGPAEDGGVTLMGARLPWPELADLPWSSDALGAALTARCRAHGMTVALLPARYDVDTLATLPRLQHDLAADTRPARCALRAWLLARQSGGVSIVVPVLDDAPALARLLPRLRGLTPAPVEVIVVDGADDAACRELCRTHSAQHVTGGAGRGAQLRLGAQHAHGALLWFLHADAEPPTDAIAQMTAAVEAGADGGYFRFRFAGHPGWPQRLLAALINLRARFGVAYGDQGIFATRSAYDAAGGFAASPLFEEVPLVRALRRRGRFIVLNTTLGVSPRRWERDGWWRRTLANRLLALAYMAGVAPERLARRYRRQGARHEHG